MTELLTAIVVFGSVIVVLMVAIFIAVWRRGTKYGRMETAYRELIAREKRNKHLDHFLNWDSGVDLDDPPRRSIR